MSGVEVATEPPTDAVVSDGRGYFVIAHKITVESDPHGAQPKKLKAILGKIAPGVYVVKLSKYRYIQESVTVDLKEGEYQLRGVVLRPKPGPFPDEPPPRSTPSPEWWE